MSNIIDDIKKKDPDQQEFHQAVQEIWDSVQPVLAREPKYRKHKVFERLVEPERAIIFRVPWVDDQGEVQINRGYRVQMNSALGPYKGGLRFHPSVNLGIIKFLAFEQIFKNALTTLPLGAGKGGSDFNPKKKSDNEVMRFCQAFIRELYRHIGPNTDIPAGDIGVGSREIGYMFGQYKKITNKFSGVLTGKGLDWGGSYIRPEATGYGCVYFAEEMLEEQGDTLIGKRCIVSGAGNVAQYVIEKLNEIGAKVVTVSDSDGFVYDEEGIDNEKLEFIKELKNEQRGRIEEYVEKYSHADYTPVDASRKVDPIWEVKADCAFPCATQNELRGADARHLVQNGLKLVAEGANMPLTPEAMDIMQEEGVLYAPGKASNAGGVAVSGLEMSQNSLRLSWTSEEVDRRLRVIMKDIHRTCLHNAKKYGQDGNYVAGANISGFLKVADSMIEQGVV